MPENIKMTSVMFSNVFQISYHVQITAKFRRAGINLCIPVYIGSVALKPEEECVNFLSHGAPLWPPNLDDGEAQNGGALVKEETPSIADSSSTATVEAALSAAKLDDE